MNGVMPAIIRTSDKPYRWKVQPVPLDQIANKEKMLPEDFITADGYGITPKARAYLQPLTSGEAELRYKNGLPEFVRLKNVAVPKKLVPFTI
jgi:6-phosphofructokinase 1